MKWQRTVLCSCFEYLRFLCTRCSCVGDWRTQMVWIVLDFLNYKKKLKNYTDIGCIVLRTSPPPPVILFPLAQSFHRKKKDYNNKNDFERLSNSSVLDVEVCMSRGLERMNAFLTSNPLSDSVVQSDQSLLETSREDQRNHLKTEFHWFVALVFLSNWSGRMIESESEMGPSFSSTKMAACGEKAFPSVPSMGILVSIQGCLFL